MSSQFVERLEKTLARAAKEQGLAQERLCRWVPIWLSAGYWSEQSQREFWMATI